jgi:hypothetical protein
MKEFKPVICSFVFFEQERIICIALRKYDKGMYICIMNPVSNINDSKDVLILS